MHATIDDMEAIDPGLVALGLLLRLHGVKAEFDQIRQKCGTAPVGTTQMLRCAKKFGLKACIHRTNWEGLDAYRKI
jgi:subfamily B ATP-binding cassette protein HlyB/CyaB